MFEKIGQKVYVNPLAHQLFVGTTFKTWLRYTNKRKKRDWDEYSQ